METETTETDYDIFQRVYFRARESGSEPNLFAVWFAPRTKKARRKIGRLLRRSLATKGEMGHMLVGGRVGLYRI